ncbi:MAG TPA: plastocyanin/azurin family copper-binding protein, partial [Acidimicrobiia bacterium]|nr:plastocyanin/azurin family copper-binding protein [Acidimicrobiia bacterium]
MRRGRWAWMLVLGVMPALTGTAEAAQTEDVALRGVKFDPDRVEISVGDTVRWSYESGGNHTLTFEDGPDYHPGCSSIGSLVADCFSSGDAPIEREFKKAGEHAYFCKVHSGMAGVVIVTDERVG